MYNTYENYQDDNMNIIEHEDYVDQPNGPKRNKKGWLRMICLCMAFTLVGVIIGGYGLNSSGNNGGGQQDVLAAADETQETDELQEIADKEDSAAIATANKKVDGSEMSASDIYTLACQQVVGITTDVTTTNAFGQTSDSSVAGTGFFITEDGYIATNYHVVSTAVSGNYPINVITFDGESYEAEYIGGDSDNDVALLKIEGSGFNAATLSDSNDMAVGEDVYVIGNALGELSYTLTSGLVSALDRQITTSSETGEASVMNMFQIDAAVNSGNSGGPVYNSKGQVIGIVTAKYSSTGVEGLGFAIPINDAGSLLMDIMENGYVSGKPSMGVSVSTVESSVASMYDMPVGAYVYEVNAGSAAENAGIQAKDIITKLDDVEITSSSDLNAAIKKYTAGDTATVTVYRSGEYVELEITFQEKEQVTEDTDEDMMSDESFLDPFGSGQSNYQGGYEQWYQGSQERNNSNLY